jgi:hypothetical protein
MNAAFIVTLDLDTADSGSLQEVAQELTDMIDAMYHVVEIKPWARPITAPAAPILGGPIPPFPSQP